MQSFARKHGARGFFALGLATLTGCYDGAGGRDPDFGGGINLPGADDGDGSSDEPGATADVPPPSRVQLRRLTRAQYGASIQDLLGRELPLPESLGPHHLVVLYSTVGATH